jgi:hypothetical protein
MEGSLMSSGLPTTPLAESPNLLTELKKFRFGNFVGLVFSLSVNPFVLRYLSNSLSNFDEI